MATWDALLGYLDADGLTQRWNFPAVIGHDAASGFGVGTAVALTWSVMAQVPSYDDPGNHPGFATLSSTQVTAFSVDLTAWAAVANVTFTQVADAGNGGQLRVGLMDMDPGTAGYAYLPSYGYSFIGTTVTDVSPIPIAGDIWLDKTVMAGSLTPSDEAYGTLLHEIGHALGLKHPFEGSITLPTAEDTTRSTVMSYTSPTNVDIVTVSGTPSRYGWTITQLAPAGPMRDDIAAIQQLYGANLATNAGDTTYSWAADARFLQTIWDGGGTDSIDASNQSLPSLIDLTAGHSSSIALRLTDAAKRLEIPTWATQAPTPSYDGVNDLTIAYNVTIENAAGGSGNDTLLGNAVANDLTGNAGNDSLSGLLGNDTLRGGTGSDTLDGGGGRDVAVLDMARAGVGLTHSGTGWTVASASGNDLLTGIEVARFTDGDVALRATATRDFAGSGADAILWRNAAGGGWVWQWQMGGLTPSGGGGQQLSTDWSVQGTGDFDGDGHADILWRNTDGNVWLWTMDGSTGLAARRVTQEDASWTIRAVADTDGDGRADIIWQHSSGYVWVMRMNGATIAGGGGLDSPGAAWSLVGAADVTGDGRADLVWQNTQTGSLYLWGLNGGTANSQADLGSLTGGWINDWKPVGLGDFDGNGHADILLRSAGTGAIAIRLVGDGLTLSDAYVGNPGTSWSVAAVGDYTGDGMADILFRNTAGQPYLWAMQGGTIIGQAALPDPGAGWQVVA